MKLQKAIDMAINRLAEQGQTPMSPCSVDAQDGKVRLCTAAAVASAGLYLAEGPMASAEFEQELAAHNDEKTLYAAFERLGLNSIICTVMKRRNDSIPQDKRQAETIDFLRTFNPAFTSLQIA